jgi:hypothetical protein
MNQTEHEAEPVEPGPEPEPEPDDDEQEAEETDSETDTQEPSTDELTPQQREQQRKKLDQSATTWRNRVSQVLGEEAQFLVPCELCDPTIPGFHWPADLEQPRDELHARLIEVLKRGTGPGYVKDPDTEQCDRCKGEGKTETGSNVPGQEYRACTKCKATGFVILRGVTSAAENGAEGPQPILAAVGAPTVVADADPWGSPRILEDGRENPNYGRMPQFKDPGLP